MHESYSNNCTFKQHNNS